MLRVFLDSDVILDYLADRLPFAVEAEMIFDALDQRKLQGFVSALSFTNVHYFLRKKLGGAASVKLLEKFRAMVSVLPVDGKVIARALASDFGDFEDAVQYYAAIQSRLNGIVTRNLRDYQKSEITVFSPADLIRNIEG
jgi:predicted nucleic acid-binding protein